MEYNPTNYQMLFRENFEGKAAMGWAVALAASGAAYSVTTLPPEPFYFMTGASALMFGSRVRAAINLWRFHKNLKGRPLEFMTLPELKKVIGNKKNKDDIWLGYGFLWEKTHAQRAYELSKRDMSDIVKQDKDQMGQSWVHGLETNEEKIFQPLKHAEGHSLILGTTGSGKTRLFDQLITQEILRTEDACILLIDPKGDQELKENARRACIAQGREDRFVEFHPGFPEESCRFDPLANFSRGTELASRIAALIQTSSGGEVFKDFSQMALNNIIQGLLVCDTRPTLVNLRRYLEGGAQALVLKAVIAYVENNAPSFSVRLQDAISSGNNIEAQAKRASKFYREFVVEEAPNSDLEGLLTMFEHDRSHFSKMVASLLPVMNMLTSGEIGKMLSPDRDDIEDTRDIIDTRMMTEQNMVVYIGLDSLTDAMIGSAIGSVMLADLAAVAGDRYNYGSDLNPVHIYVDEASEVLNDPLLQIANKGRGAKLRLTIATQTIADVTARLGSADKAMQVLGNINNMIALRCIDNDTQEYITKNLPKTRAEYVMNTQGMSLNGEKPFVFGGNHGERLMEEEIDLFTPQLLGLLPNLEFIAKISGKFFKGRLPILVDEK